MSYVYADAPDAGIDIKPECVGNGTCKLQIYNTLQIRRDTGGDNTPKTFVEDIFLWATFFIGTMAAMGLIISGMLMVFWWASESMYEKWKQWFKYSIIGLLLVVLSYVIIRITQYVAQGVQ